MEVLHTMQSCMKILGINQENGHFGGVFCTYTAIQMTMVLNVIFFMISRWDELDERILALKTFAFMFAFIAYSVSVFFYWDDFLAMIQLFYQIRFAIPYKVTPQRKMMFDDLDVDMKGHNNAWWYLIVIYVTLTIAVPITVVILKSLLFSGDIQKLIKENAAFPYPFYYPEFTNNDPLLNILVYAIGYLLHTAYIILTGVLAQMIYVTSLCAIANVEHELKLMTLSLSEMEDTLKNESDSLVHKYDDVINLNGELQFFMNYIVQHHQETYRKFDVANKGVRWIAITLCSVASLYICMSIFTIVQKDQLILKLQEAVFGAVWSCGICLFDVCGERVSTEADNLRSALYNSSWFEKPQWFKKSLLVIMTRACRPLDIKPFGLYGFNLNGYSKTMNAAYAYYNLLSKVTNK